MIVFGIGCRLLRWGSGWQVDVDGCPLIWFGFGGYYAVVFTDNGIAECQSPSSPFLGPNLFGGLVGDNFWGRLHRRNADPGVGKFEVNVITRLERKFILFVNAPCLAINL